MYSRDLNDKTSKGVKNSNNNGHNRTMMVNGNAMNAKQTTATATKKNGLVSRSKSMSGLNRVDASKINGSSSDGRSKGERSPLVQSISSHSLINGSYINLTIKGNE